MLELHTDNGATGSAFVTSAGDSPAAANGRRLSSRPRQMIAANWLLAATHCVRQAVVTLPLTNKFSHRADHTAMAKYRILDLNDWSKYGSLKFKLLSF